jgi:hypothetical protein
MTMATQPRKPGTAKLVKHDSVQVEFLIDDLVKELVANRVADFSCNGCNNCSAAIERPIKEEK